MRDFGEKIREGGYGLGFRHDPHDHARMEVKREGKMRNREREMIHSNDQIKTQEAKDGDGCMAHAR